MSTIQAKQRDPKASVSFLRKEGFIPAVFYGMDKKTTSITISLKDFIKTWKEAGESSAITLKTDAGQLDALIHDVALDPVTDIPIHADFFIIDATKKIKVNIPLDFTGIAPAVKNGLGTLVKVLHEVEVEALPKNLPHAILVDITSLVSLESQITVGDIVFPEGVMPVTKDHEVVAAISTMKEEKEEVAGPVDLSAIEVEKKGKKEEAETGEAAAELAA